MCPIVFEWVCGLVCVFEELLWRHEVWILSVLERNRIFEPAISQSSFIFIKEVFWNGSSISKSKIAIFLRLVFKLMLMSVLTTWNPYKVPFQFYWMKLQVLHSEVIVESDGESFCYGSGIQGFHCGTRTRGKSWIIKFRSIIWYIKTRKLLWITWINIRRNRLIVDFVGYTQSVTMA